MKITVDDNIFGSGTQLSVDSVVVIKRRHDKSFYFSKKVGKRFIMSKELSLKFIAIILSYMTGDGKHLVISLKYDDKFITCICLGKMFSYYLDIGITDDKYISKFKDLYLPARAFLFYSNADITIPGKDVTYFPINDAVIKKLTKRSVSPSQIAVLAIMAIITFFMLRLVYTEVLIPKKTALKPQRETAEEVYHDFLKGQMQSSLAKVTPILTAALDPYEKITGIDGDNITVESVVFKPSYVQEGYMYKRTYTTSTLPVRNEKSGLGDGIPRPDTCPTTISDLYAVVDYRDALVKGKPYQFREAVLMAKTPSFNTATSLLADSLKRCVVIRNIHYSKEGGFNIEASKFQQYSQ